MKWGEFLAWRGIQTYIINQTMLRDKLQPMLYIAQISRNMYTLWLGRAFLSIKKMRYVLY